MTTDETMHDTHPEVTNGWCIHEWGEWQLSTMENYIEYKICRLCGDRIGRSLYWPGRDSLSPDMYAPWRWKYRRRDTP